MTQPFGAHSTTDDVLAGVDHLVRRGWADPGRVAAMGHSYGGSLCAFLATTSSRFKALEVDAGVADWALNYGTTDHPPFAPHLLRPRRGTTPTSIGESRPFRTSRRQAHRP